MLTAIVELAIGLVSLAAAGFLLIRLWDAQRHSGKSQGR